MLSSSFLRDNKVVFIASPSDVIVAICHWLMQTTTHEPIFSPGVDSWMDFHPSNGDEWLVQLGSRNHKGNSFQMNLMCSDKIDNLTFSELCDSFIETDSGDHLYMPTYSFLSFKKENDRIIFTN